MSPFDIHDAALAIPSTEARQRYLDEACGGDEHLRRRVEAMLGIDEHMVEDLPAPGRFLKGWSARRLPIPHRSPKAD
jgi:hypothetical protein